MKKSKAVLCVIFAAAGFVPLFAVATATINVNLPGPSSAASGIAGWIVNFYSFALTISGILAFGAISYGGIKYAFARGNPSAESDAKSWILNALYGLLLLAGAVIILYTINPNILSLQIPGLPQLTAAPAAPSVPVFPGQPAPSASPTAACQAPASGACSVANLLNNGGSCFGNGVTLAAGVCNVESANGAFLYSTTDKCADGSPVSFGLFQINITANQIGGLNCPAAFDAKFTGSHPTCNVVNRTLYNECEAAALNVANNIAAACQISNNGTNFSKWGPNTRAKCGIP